MKIQKAERKATITQTAKERRTTRRERPKRVKGQERDKEKDKVVEPKAKAKAKAKPKPKIPGGVRKNALLEVMEKEDFNPDSLKIKPETVV